MADHSASMPSYHEVFRHDESDDEDDNVENPRTSTELAHYDQEVIRDEEENEKLLTGQVKNPWRNENPNSGLPNRLSRKHIKETGRNTGQGGASSRNEKGELMQDTGEDKDRSRSASLSESSMVDRETFATTHTGKPSRFSRFIKYILIPLTLVVLFSLISYGAYKASGKGQHQSKAATINLKSNGTALFAPTTILVSLDGFRADFLDRGLTPTLNAFIQEGVSPKYMTPSFPSVTFPNHFTLVTGLYPESHGIVGNSFWDAELQEEFYYQDAARSMQSKWWNGEPVWLTAEDQGVRVATHMWPGSEAKIGDIQPAFVDKYNGSELLERKVDRILELLDKPGFESASTIDSRPQLILAYVPNVDSDGHRYGPNSTEIRSTIKAADSMLSSILQGLKQRNLTEIVNVVVVSDHGMATTSVTRLVQFEDLIDPTLIEHIDGWPHYGLRPYSQDPEVWEMLYNRLLTSTAHQDGFDVYLRDKTMPERYHFSKNQRIAPLWLVAKTGWAIVTKKEMDVQEALSDGAVYHPRGIHGYDHEHPLMRAIFVARGPAFPHQPGSKVEVFQNTEVYNIICDSIGVTPRMNNGTIRLPFKPVGLHSDDIDVQGNLVADPPVTSFIPQVSTIMAELASPTVASTMLDFIKATSATNVPDLSRPSFIDQQGASDTRPVVEDKPSEVEDETTWQAWFTGHLNGLKTWVGDLVQKIKGEDTAVEGQDGAKTGG